MNETPSEPHVVSEPRDKSVLDEYRRMQMLEGQLFEAQKQLAAAREAIATFCEHPNIRLAHVEYLKQPHVRALLDIHGQQRLDQQGKKEQV